MRSDTYDQDGLTSVHNHEFMDDPRFVAAYARGAKAVGQDYLWHWRVHIGLWAAHTASRLPGDFVECGVNRGFLASSIMTFLEWDRLDKRFYLLDTFRGIDPRFVSSDDLREGVPKKNEELIASGFYATESASVRANFSEWRNVSIVEGAIPETLPLVTAERVPFLHIDLNCAAPETAALEYFWDRLVVGAPVLLDYYAFAGYRHQQVAMDALTSRFGVSVASLPTGQGLLLKT
jgi:hypothetical protein